MCLSHASQWPVERKVHIQKMTQIGVGLSSLVTTEGDEFGKPLAQLFNQVSEITLDLSEGS